MSVRMVQISDVAEIVSGATPKTSNSEYWDGDIFWATPADLSALDGPYISHTPRKITESGLKSCAASVLPPYSVLFSSRAPIGHVAVNTFPMATNQGFKSFIPDRKRLDPKFLYWWLKAHRPQLEALGNGATFKEVSKATVSRIEIPLPPLDEQKRIAAILDKADALRRKRRQALALLDSLTQSIFLEMFDAENYNKSKVSLDDVCSVIRDGTHSTPKYVEAGIPFVTVKNISSGSLSLDGSKYITYDTHMELTKRVKPQRGDILVSKDGSIGIPCIVDTDTEFSIFVSVALLKPIKERVNSIFLSAQLGAEAVQRQIREYSKGVAIRHLHLADFRRLQITLPSIEIQDQFAARIDNIQRKKEMVKASCEGLDSLFASLQHRAFTGQL